MIPIHNLLRVSHAFISFSYWVFRRRKIQSPGDPMCDAICSEQYLYTFSKSLEGYSLRVSFQNMDGETETLEAVFNGEVTSAYAMVE